MTKHIQGIITRNYDGFIDIDGYDFVDLMYEVAAAVGFAKRHNKGLGGKRAFIDDCNIRMYFTNKECELDEAEIALLVKLEVEGYLDDHEAKEELSGVFDLTTRLTGYSEWTITGYDVETCTLGGHNLLDILGNHIGEYVNMVIEAEEM
jgi:hypothetical protein